MVEIRSIKDFEIWLQGRDPRIAAALALRCAERVWPFAFDPEYLTRSASQRQQLLATNRALLMARLSSLTGRPSASRSLINLGAARASRSARSGERAAASRNKNSIAHAIEAADGAAHAVRVIRSPQIGRKLGLRHDDSVIWANLADDCVAANHGANSEAMIKRGLFTTKMSLRLADRWSSGIAALKGTGSGFEVWAEFFTNRLSGSETSWSMSSNADAELSHRLIEADNEWWDRDPAEVNGDIARWLEELRGPDRAQIIEQNSPVIVEDAQGRVDIAPNPQFDRITNRIALRQALIELRPIADTLNGCLDGNRIMPSLNLTLVDYRARISGDVDAILWGLVDRYAQAIKAGFKELDRAELDEPTWVHVDHFIELHDACIACSARVAADPVPELDEARLTPQALRNPFTVLQDAKERLLEGDHSTPAFDNYVAEAIELGRTLELPRPDASPEARKSRLASLGATLASTGAVFENLDKIISAGARFVDWAAKPEVLRSIKKAAEALWALFSWK